MKNEKQNIFDKLDSVDKNITNLENEIHANFKAIKEEFTGIKEGVKKLVELIKK